MLLPPSQKNTFGASSSRIRDSRCRTTAQSFARVGKPRSPRPLPARRPTRRRVGYEPEAVGVRLTRQRCHCIQKKRRFTAEKWDMRDDVPPRFTNRAAARHPIQKTILLSMFLSKRVESRESSVEGRYQFPVLIETPPQNPPRTSILSKSSYSSHCCRLWRLLAGCRLLGRWYALISCRNLAS